MWIEDCILSNNGDSAKFKIIGAKLHVPIVTLSNKDNIYLTKQLSDEFKRFVYRNSYQTKPAKVIEKGKNIYSLLNASFQGGRRFFALVYFVTAGALNDEAGIKTIENNFLKGEIENYKVFIEGENFYHQPINYVMK